jgi:hypothetical protein
MYALASDEKASGVMIYTQNTLICGEAVTKQSTRVSVWMRTEGAPEYIHLLRTQVVNLTGNDARRRGYSEMYLPAAKIIAFHLTPPTCDPLEYDESEMNRKMQPITVLVGTFIFNGTIRISTQVDLGTSITSGRAVWLSIYDVKVSNTLLPQMGELEVPMLLVRPNQTSFALSD